MGIVESDGSPIRDDENLPIRNVLHTADRGLKRQSLHCLLCALVPKSTHERQHKLRTRHIHSIYTHIYTKQLCSIYAMYILYSSKTLSITSMDSHLIVLSSAAERICWSLLHHRAFFMAEVWPAISWGSALQMPYSSFRLLAFMKGIGFRKLIWYQNKKKKVTLHTCFRFVEVIDAQYFIIPSSQEKVTVLLIQHTLLKTLHLAKRVGTINREGLETWKEVKSPRLHH